MPKNANQVPIRFTSFGAFTSQGPHAWKSHVNAQQEAGGTPPGMRAPLGIEGFPPLPKSKQRKGSAVQAVQEAEAAAAASRSHTRSRHKQQSSPQPQPQQPPPPPPQQQQQQQQLQADPQGCPRSSPHQSSQPPADTPLTPRGTAHPPGRSGPDPAIAQLEQRCKSLRQQLQQIQHESNMKSSTLSTGLCELLAILKQKGYEVAAGLDSLQDELYEDELADAPEPPSVGAAGAPTACEPTLVTPSVSSPPPVSPSLGAPTHPGHINQGPNLQGGGDAEAPECEASTASISHIISDASVSNATPSRSGVHKDGEDGLPGCSHTDQESVLIPGSGAVGSVSLLQSEKLVILRAKRDHVETEFIELVRISICTLEKLLEQL